MTNAPATTPATSGGSVTPAPPKGRVLFIGSSYYNNWYASAALRKRGWVAHTLCSSGEGADLYLHGSDYIVEPKRVSGLSDDDERRLRKLTERLRDEFMAESRGARTLNLLAAAGATVRSMWPSRADPDAQPERVQAIEAQVRNLASPSPDDPAGAFRELIRLVNPSPAPSLEPITGILDRYDVIHFTGVNSTRLLYYIDPGVFGNMPVGWDVQILRHAGKKIVYTAIGCLDGVSQKSFSRWGDVPVCSICKWRDVPEVCSDKRNLAWGNLRNRLSDYIINLGGNNADLNLAPHVHEEPEFFCLDSEFWKPDLEVPDKFRMKPANGAVRIYHAVGNFYDRTSTGNKNIKTTHVIVPAIEKLKADGFPVELVFCTGMRNMDVRFVQVQADIVVDMLTYGFFGANIREAMMLGKTAVCYLRPEWMTAMRREIPEYVDELPVVSATPETVYDVLAGLVRDPARRAELGRRGRAFAMKWHSAEAAGRRLDQIYSALIAGRSDAPRSS